jgi:pilus assembly protein Flp/PilA
MKTLINRFLKDESGATAIEYGLIAALLSVAIITALGGVKEQLNETYNKIKVELSTANGG